jgi:hypothetical protein
LKNKKENTMSTNEDFIAPMEGKTPIDISGNYQPIHLEDTVGVIFLGILSILLLIGWRRSETRYRKLMEQREIHQEERGA